MIKNLLNKHKVLLFFILTYIISWLLWLPMVIEGQESFLLRTAGTFGPLAAALLLTAAAGGRDALKKLLKPLLIWRVGFGWYLFSFFATAVISGAAILIFLAAGGEKPEFNDIRQIYLIIPVFFYVLFLSVAGEETGWRGYALPALLKKMSPLSASVIIGLVWGAWHLPLFMIADNFHNAIPLWIFLLQDVALSVIMTWMYRRTKGSLLLIHLLHAASNTTLGVLPVLPHDNGGNTATLNITVALLCCFTAVLVIKEKMWKKT